MCTYLPPDNYMRLKQIPEFFYLPEFLICTNDVNLGALPNGMDIKDVELPPWADSAHTFIQLNRAALGTLYI